MPSFPTERVRTPYSERLLAGRVSPTFSFAELGGGSDSRQLGAKLKFAY